MFDSFYPYQYKRYSKTEENNHPCKKHIFSFRGKYGHRYQVNVEEYEYEFFALKFHLEEDHDRSEHKYEKLTNLCEVAPVLRTCLNIILQIKQENPLASFGFVGSPMPGESNKKFNTKRYRIYRRIIANFFSPVNFHHFMNEEQSTYVLLNKASQQKEENLLFKLEQLMVELHSVG